MKRLIFTGLVILFFLFTFTNTQISSVQPVQFSLENDDIKFNFELDLNEISLKSIVKKDNSHTFDVKGILWKVRLIDHTQLSNNNYVEITKSERNLFCTVSYNIQQSGVLIMRWDDCAVDQNNKFNLIITVSLDQNSDYGNWRINVENNMVDYSLLYIKLFFGILKDPDDYAVIENQQIKNPATTIGNLADPYIDGGGIPMKLKIVPYWTSDNDGLYFISKDTLPPHYQGTSMTADGQRFVYGHFFYPDQLGIVGNDLSMNYDFSVGVFNGDWYDAAKIYRAWALNQPWADIRLENRNDIPQYWKELDLGEVRHSPNTNITYEINSWKKIKDFYDIDNLVVLYWFGVSTLDFQPQPWTSQLVGGLNPYGISIFAYTNSQVMDINSPFYNQISAYTCRNLLNQPIISGSIARNDYTNPNLHDWYADKVRNNIASSGYKGIFFEIPLPDPICYNGLPNPVGGTKPWEGMTEFIRKERDAGRQIHSDFVIAYEFFYEAFFEVSDAIFSVGTHLPNSCLSYDCDENVKGVPFLSAIYHDVMPILGVGTFLQSPFGNYNLPLLDQFIAMVFSWGEIIHTKEPFIDSHHVLNHEANQIQNPLFTDTVNYLMNHTLFLKKILSARKYAKKYLIYGEMLRPIPSNINDVLLTLDGFKPGVTQVVPVQIHKYIPEVPNSVWRSTDGKTGLVFANPSLSVKNFIFSFPLQSYGLSTSPHYGLFELNESGSILIYEFDGNLNNYQVQMRPKSVKVYEIYGYSPGVGPSSCGNSYPACNGACPVGLECEQSGTGCVCTSPESPPTVQPNLPIGQQPTYGPSPTVSQPPPAQPIVPVEKKSRQPQIKEKIKSYKYQLAILLIIVIICSYLIIKSMFKGGPKMEYGGK